MWAQRIGIRWVEHPPGYAPRWTTERIHRELEQFLAGRTVWPSRLEFEAAGLKTLREAINRLGGVETWAKEFNLPLANHAAGSRRVWDEQRLEQALAPLVQRLGRWPTKGEFHRAGLASGLSAMYRYGGVEYWRERLGAPPSRKAHSPVPLRRVWTEERIERELRVFWAGRTAWPTWHEFTGAGESRLYRAASQYGGAEHWRERLGLQPCTRPKASAVDGEA
jgi:hypothetical protein